MLRDKEVELVNSIKGRIEKLGYVFTRDTDISVESLEEIIPMYIERKLRHSLIDPQELSKSFFGKKPEQLRLDVFLSEESLVRIKESVASCNSSVYSNNKGSRAQTKLFSDFSIFIWGILVDFSVRSHIGDDLIMGLNDGESPTEVDLLSKKVI
ncbi:hypothetical protein Calle1_84 [Cellulophaga phage Calle_1]|uniref:Uncharacterized protein n=1 Tax=Cellulophaga phage Calle_1 TaxID=2745643 RepID=A0A8E4ZJ16_9CAUD|nr:hypothetical protein M1M22_gp031 [Cellulophaga phage Calle_1]QQV89731.1 hypothetical protein Calle1_84 [Cellulophaga phage Calle_1]QQV89858.1 hypothetical protein Calle2_84 [Cellulophaga phage Calle_2]QQV89861.1 hypothetical protein Calle3_84 [Cellulophaga phage Calle_3]